jgi:hypothetical protein
MTRTGAPYTQWRCRARVGGPPNCGKVAVSAALLEETLTAEVFDSVRDGALVRSLGRRDRKAKHKAEKDEGRDLADVERRMEELESLFADGAIDGAQLSRLNRKLIARREDLLSKIAAEDGRHALAPFTRSPHALEKAWPSLDVATQGAVLRALLDRVEVSPAKGRGRYSFERERIVPYFRH